MKPVTNFKDKFEQCVFDNWTSDLALLRYGGPIPILLTEPLGSIATHLVRGGCNVNQDFKTLDTSCETEEKLVPLQKDVAKSRQSRFPYSTFVLENELPQVGLTAQYVSGRLMTVGLKAIQLLDEYFFNSARTERVLVDIKKRDDRKEITCAYMYLTKPGVLFPKGLLAEGLALEPFRTTIINGRTVYRYKEY